MSLAIEAFAAHLLSSLPSPSSPFTDASELIETADGAELVTVGKLSKEIDTFLGIGSRSASTAKGVTTWRDLESATRVSERVLRRFVATRTINGSDSPSALIQWSGGVASVTWTNTVQTHLAQLFAEERNNYRLLDLAGKLHARGLFPTVSSIPPAAISDLLTLLISQPVAGSDNESSSDKQLLDPASFPLGKFDPADKTVLATTAGLARQHTALLDVAAACKAPTPISTLQTRVEETGLTIAKAEFDRSVNHLSDLGNVARGLFVPRTYFNGLVESIATSLDQSGYLEYSSVLRDPAASSAFPDAQDFLRRNLASRPGTRLVMLANAVVTPTFIDRTAAEMDELLEEQGWVDLAQAVPFVLEEADERASELAPIWRTGSRVKLGHYLVDRRLLEQIIDRMKPSVEKLGLAKGLAQRNKSKQAQRGDEGKPILKLDDTVEEAHKMFPAIPTLLVPEIIEHLLPALETLATAASTSIFTLQETPVLKLPQIQPIWAQLEGFAKGAALIADEGTRTALVSSLADSAIMTQLLTALETAGKRADGDRIVAALKKADISEFNAIVAELSGSTPMDEGASKAATKLTEDALKKQLTEAQDAALVVHIASLLLFQKLTGKPLLATGRFVPKILSHLGSLDTSEEGAKKLLKLIQSQQKNVIKSLKDPSAVKPEDLQSASADIKQRLL